MNALFSLVGCSIVFADEDTGIIVAWNHSLTFSIFSCDRGSNGSVYVSETDEWTVQDVPSSVEEAKRIAERHMQEMQGNDEE